MIRDCSRCIHVGETLADPDDLDEGLYLCNWMVDQLPVSMQFANRERGAVHNSDAERCCCYAEKTSEI